MYTIDQKVITPNGPAIILEVNEISETVRVQHLNVYGMSTPRTPIEDRALYGDYFISDIEPCKGK